MDCPNVAADASMCAAWQVVYVMHATPDGMLHTPDPLDFAEEHEQQLSRCGPRTQSLRCSALLGTARPGFGLT